MPYRHAFSGNPLDRSGDLRNDAAWLAEQEANPEALAMILWEKECLKKHELPGVPKMDSNSNSYPVSERSFRLPPEGLFRAIWDHLGRLATTVSGTVGGPSGVGSAARTSNFERGIE